MNSPIGMPPLHLHRKVGRVHGGRAHQHCYRPGIEKIAHVLVRGDAPDTYNCQFQTVGLDNIRRALDGLDAWLVNGTPQHACLHKSIAEDRTAIWMEHRTA